jgi:hypothetical protein
MFGPRDIRRGAPALLIRRLGTKNPAAKYGKAAADRHQRPLV